MKVAGLISNNTFSTEHFRTAASEHWQRANFKEGIYDKHILLK